MRALARRPEDRYPSVRALLAAIHDVPDEPTAPRAVVAPRSVAGNIDATTQIRPTAKKKRATLAWGAAKAIEHVPVARPARRGTAAFDPVAMRVEAPTKPLATPEAAASGPRAAQGSIAAEASSVMRSAAPVEPAAPPSRPTQPQLSPYSPHYPSTSESERFAHTPLVITDTPAATSAAIPPEPRAVSVGVVLAVLALIAVIGGAWWFMPDAPQRPPEVERRPSGPPVARPPAER